MDEPAVARGAGVKSVDVEARGHAGTFLQARQNGGVVDAVLRHMAIGGPLAAADGDEAGVFDANGVVAGKRRGVAGISGAHQRTNAGEDAGHIAAVGLLREVEGRGPEHELDFPLLRHRLERGLVDRRVGGADQRVAVPGNGEHHAAVAGVRDHDGAVAGQKGAVEHQVDALAGSDDGLHRGVRHAAQIVGERSRWR